MKFRTMHRKFGAKLAAVSAVGFASVVGSGLASAAIDTTEALAAVDDASTFITTVGLAVLTMLFVLKGIKWARRAG